MRYLEIEFAGYTIIADISGALYIPDEKILVVADLHFGKGMRLAAGGALVPPYDLQATLPLGKTHKVLSTRDYCEPWRRVR